MRADELERKPMPRRKRYAYFLLPISFAIRVVAVLVSADMIDSFLDIYAAAVRTPAAAFTPDAA